MNGVIWGWLAVIGSIISFGSFGVPIKSKKVFKTRVVISKVVEAEVDPIIFQTFKSFWVFATSFITFTYNDFSYTPWGLLGGLIMIYD